jgi:hypothetical protein
MLNQGVKQEARKPGREGRKGKGGLCVFIVILIFITTEGTAEWNEPSGTRSLSGGELKGEQGAAQQQPATAARRGAPAGA